MSLLRRIFLLLLGFRRLRRFGRRFLFGLRRRRSGLFLWCLVFRVGLLVSFVFLYVVWMCWGGMMKGARINSPLSSISWFMRWGGSVIFSVMLSFLFPLPILSGENPWLVVSFGVR